MGDMPKMIIEVRGGIIQEVYCDTNELDIEVVDWDCVDPEDRDDREEYIGSMVSRRSMKRVPF